MTMKINLGRNGRVGVWRRRKRSACYVVLARVGWRAGNNKLICSQREFRPEGPFSALNCPAPCQGGKFNARKGGGAASRRRTTHETDSLTDRRAADSLDG